jgi:RNA 3'-terminal phosphate cyclase (ATP)
MSEAPVVIDGSFGEGGGQILRTGIALSLITRRPVRFVNVRARRQKPGLRPQHRTAVLAAARIGAARTDGVEVGSRELEFWPATLVAGHHVFDIGTAGSATLVLHTILPALLTADAPSRIEIIGGTHNPLAPSFDFIDKSFVPQITRMGARVDLRLLRHGFYPAGGGRIVCTIEPAVVGRLELPARGKLLRARARALVSKIPRHVAERELAVVRSELGFDDSALEVVELDDVAGPGNALLIELEHDHVTEVFQAIGERGIRAETVAQRAVKEARSYLASDVAVGGHLADQLLLPMALGTGGWFTTLEPTLHTRTNADVIRRFLPVEIVIEPARIAVNPLTPP